MGGQACDLILATVFTSLLSKFPKNPLPGRIFCVDSEFEVNISGFRHPEAKFQGHLHRFFLLVFYIRLKRVHRVNYPLTGF